MKRIIFVGVALMVVLIGYGVFVISSQKARSSRLLSSENYIALAKVEIKSESFVKAHDLLNEAQSYIPNPQTDAETERLKEITDLITFIDSAYKEQLKAAELAQRIEDQKRAERNARREAAIAVKAKEKNLQEQARKMYPKYKESAETVADKLLEIHSATEIGISYVKYNEMLTDLQFLWNKFMFGCSDSEKQHKSFSALSKSRDSFYLASQVWKQKIDDIVTDEDGTALIRASWTDAMTNYEDAMAAMGEGD